MGVRGLTRLTRTYCTPRRVELGPEHRLLLDGPGLTFHLYKEFGLDWLGGGELSSFADCVRSFVQKLKGSGVKVEAFFDATHAVDHQKLECTIRRRLDDVRTVTKIVTAMEQGENPTNFILPLLAFDTVRTVLVQAGVPVLQASAVSGMGYEADPYIARAAAGDEAAIVLTNDSDMIVFNAVCSVAFFDNLAVTDTGLAVARVYERKQIASTLGIDQEDLPKLACLTGNDHSNDLSLGIWHGKLRLNMSSLNSLRFLEAAAVSIRDKDLDKKLGESWIQASQDVCAWYRLKKNDMENGPSEEKFMKAPSKPCYWWPRPVIENFDHDLYVADIMRPLRLALGLNVPERCPPNFHLQEINSKKRGTPPPPEVLQTLQTYSEELIRSRDANKIIQIAHLCLHVSRCKHSKLADFANCQSCITHHEYHRLRALWPSLLSSDISDITNVGAETSGKKIRHNVHQNRYSKHDGNSKSTHLARSRASSLSSLMQGVIHTVFVANPGYHDIVPLELLFNSSQLNSQLH